MAKANINSINMGTGDKIAALGNTYKAQMQANLKSNGEPVSEQVVNARKAANLANAKAKARKKAKIAKASRKKNK